MNIDYERHTEKDSDRSISSLLTAYAAFGIARKFVQMTGNSLERII